MSTPLDPAKLALVHKAITCGLRGCCEWKDQAYRRLRQSPIANLTVASIREELIRYVLQGGQVTQLPENREEYSDHEFYYKVVLPVPGLVRGLFVELILTDEDPDVPEVLIVNVHEQR